MNRRLPPLLTLLLLASTSTVGAQARDTEGEAAMLERINALRIEAALPPLVRHAALDEAALVHSMDMAEHAMLAHVSPRTGDPAARVADTGVHATRIAQNIALRRSTAEALVSILESEPHREQLLTPELTHVGVAAVQGARGMYVTQVVAELEGPAPLPPPALHDLRGAPAPEPHVEEAAPAPEATPDVDTVPDAPAAPEAAGAPEAAAASESAGAPEAAGVPEAAAAPEPAALPEAAAAPEPAAVPEAAAAPEPETGALEAPIDPRERAYAEAPASAPPDVAAAAPAAGAPTVRLPYGARPGVAGYWVFYGSRWWFFPTHGNEAPGTVLHADPSFDGPPHGYDAAGRPTSPVVAPPPPRRPVFGWSPRRHYPQWIQSF